MTTEDIILDQPIFQNKYIKKHHVTKFLLGCQTNKYSIGISSEESEVESDNVGGIVAKVQVGRRKETSSKELRVHKSAKRPKVNAIELLSSIDRMDLECGRKIRNLLDMKQNVQVLLRPAIVLNVGSTVHVSEK
jgi:hypothetical protein